MNYFDRFCRLALIALLAFALKLGFDYLEKTGTVGAQAQSRDRYELISNSNLLRYGETLLFEPSTGIVYYGLIFEGKALNWTRIDPKAEALKKK